uniref:DNA repair protein SWI5 homolog n=1 Tax=Cyprinus carpio TaxID=7962 RepID=A0A8C2C806_CYPCA
ALEQGTELPAAPRAPQHKSESESHDIFCICRGFVEQELDQHIELLHEYNDIKDIAQTLLGRLAGVRGVTTRDLYSHFGLELDD